VKFHAWMIQSRWKNGRKTVRRFLHENWIHSVNSTTDPQHPHRLFAGAHERGIVFRTRHEAEGMKRKIKSLTHPYYPHPYPLRVVKVLIKEAA
jgi:hypothetical protein